MWDIICIIAALVVIVMLLILSFYLLVKWDSDIPGTKEGEEDCSCDRECDSCCGRGQGPYYC